MTLLRGLIAIIGIIFAGIIYWAITSGNFTVAGQWLTTDPWGVTTLVDLYFGFLLIAIIIFLFEGSWRAAFWIVPIPFLGNVWVCIWFCYRLPEIARRLRSNSA